MNDDIQLVCPHCQDNVLNNDVNTLSCSKCGNSWPDIDGIPSFINSDFFWAECGITREVLLKINKDISSTNWKEVLSNHEKDDVRTHSLFISDLDRAKWHKHLNLDANSTILDLGAGMGTISQALSQKYRSVYAVEPVKERVDFLKQRFRQEKCNNIKIIHSDIDNLPFPVGSFDLIVLNGVLEWLPYNNKDCNPRELQIHYLKKLQTLLKVGGYIYIGIENRFFYGNFSGYLDPHIQIKYVTILPRMIAHIICKYKINDTYRPYIYSNRGYAKLLRSAAFQDIQIFSALPSYNDPKYITSLEKDSSVFQHLLMQSEKVFIRFLKNILIRLDVLKYFGHSYIVFGRKNSVS